MILAAPASVWLLVFVLFTKDGSAAVSDTFASRFVCEQRMADVATHLEKDKKVTGWTVPVACTEIPPASPSNGR